MHTVLPTAVPTTLFEGGVFLCEHCLFWHCPYTFRLHDDNFSKEAGVRGGGGGVLVLELSDRLTFLKLCSQYLRPTWPSRQNLYMYVFVRKTV